MSDPDTPTGIAIGYGAVAMVAAGLVGAAVPAGRPGWRLAVIGVAVGLFATVSRDRVALAFVAVTGALIFNGFLEDRMGQLSWHGSADLWRLSVLILAGATGLALGAAYRYLRDVRSGYPAPRPATEARDA